MINELFNIHIVIITIGRCVSPDSLVHLKFYDSVFGHLQEKPPQLLNCLIKCSLSQVPVAKVSINTLYVHIFSVKV